MFTSDIHMEEAYLQEWEEKERDWSSKAVDSVYHWQGKTSITQTKAKVTFLKVSILNSKKKKLQSC